MKTNQSPQQQEQQHGMALHSGTGTPSQTMREATFLTQKAHVCPFSLRQQQIPNLEMYIANKPIKLKSFLDFFLP